MYMDGVILLSLVVVVLTCAIVVYLGVYALKHIRKDMERSASDAQKKIS